MFTDGNKTFELGDIVGVTGLELNFWMKPKTELDQAKVDSILKFLNQIEVFYQITKDAQGVYGNAIQFSYGGKTNTGTLVLHDPFIWMNVNLRVQFGSYITLSVWQGSSNVDPSPEVTISHPNPSSFQSIIIDIRQMSPLFFVYLADVRVFELDSTRSYAQYFKYYLDIWPTDTATTFDKQRENYQGYSGVVQLDMLDPNNKMTNPDPIEFPIGRCDYSKSVRMYKDALGNQLFACDACSQADCIVCPKNYNGICKFCKKGSTTCLDDAPADECPLDFYLTNGVCMRCPPGCSSCSSAKQCIDCDTGLNMFQNLTHKICKCPMGQYGTPNFVTDKLVCQNCDNNKCYTCEDKADFCTACKPGTGLYLYDNKCVSDCKIQAIPSFTNVPEQKCYPCGEYCQDCVNATYCNTGKCQWDAAVDGIHSYNHNGNCQTICPDNSLTNDISKTCDDCGSNCAICSKVVTNCTVCNLGYYLERTSTAQSTCMTKCPAGKYPDGSNVCQTCPYECVLCEAASQCTVCRKLEAFVGGNKRLYYFVNFKCVETCPDRYYKDSLDINDLFCRSCPSGCNQCDTEDKCTVCDLGWYIDTFKLEQQWDAGQGKFVDRNITLCVSKCQPGYYPRNATDKWKCEACLDKCERCDNTTHCAKCMQGYVLDIDTTSDPATTSCESTCRDNFYANSENECKPCINGCKTCYNNFSCEVCKNGFFKVDDTQKCVPTTCPSGYYLQTPNCTRCSPECLTCSTGITCDTCIIGYDYQSTGGKCITKCGNGVRDDDEECDDNNEDSDDGCSSKCQTEPGYVCMPLNSATAGPDVCFCDAKPLSASWTSYWGQIEISFSSTIVYNALNGPKSTDAKLFCSQILEASMFANKLLGTDYSCFLDASPTQSSIRINVDLDSTIGNNEQFFTTTVKFLNDALRVKGCSVSIPLTYTLTNLPLDSPTVYFQSSLNGMLVPKCSSYYGINIFTSKGFTKRNVNVQWIINSMNPDDSEFKQELQDYLDLKYSGVKYFELLPDQIERLAGRTLIIKSSVTNFLGLNGANTTKIEFSNTKSLMLMDLQDIYTFQTAVDNTIAPRVRIPYCSGDASELQEEELLYVQLQCTLYSSDLARKTPLTNCTIPAFNMTLGQQYKVKVMALNLKDPNMGVTKWVHIDTASPNSRIAYIEGCNRLFSVNDSFDLEAMISTNVSYAKFNWFCTDLATGSPCFTTSFSYITMTNTKKVTIPGGQLFSNNTYQLKVIVFDSLSQTQDEKQCLMYAAVLEDRVVDIVVDTEANRNGFIDFNAQMAAFKVQTRSLSNINRNNLNFTWKFTDSSGTVFPSKSLSIYQNSLGILISKLERSNVYQVETNLTYGQMKGYLKTTYETEPEMSFKFSVEPPEGEPHKTVFTFSVTSQDTVDGLYQYVFGYVNPVDKISQIPIYQKATNRYQRTMLPVPDGQNYLTCYVQVMLPSGESKTYQQNVTMANPSITVADFKQQLRSAVMDDLVESMQIMNKLVTLRSKMTLADRSFALNQILKGLQSENTPLSDYNIQSSVASLLEYISKETESLMSDPQIVTVAANLFKQITIGENKDIKNGRYSQFGRAATYSLYNFANNLFQKDFSNVIGGNQQLQMKVMFMQGLKNILKGSLSNQILGDLGGFSYQGQNIYVKAVKFDQLESKYAVNASLPKSLDGKLIQNFVNITLPGSSSTSNPCQGKEACQVSVIILDTPVNTFLSNQKDSKLMSIFVDVSIQETEVSSPFSYVQIKDLPILNLKDPIQLTIPLLTEFTDTSSNRTLGCGYLDENDQIFKADGLKAVIINTKLVTCQASHLTAIGVEEFAVERQAAADDTSLTVVSNSTSSDSSLNSSLQVIDMWGSWAVYTTFGLLGALLLGCIWGYRRDKRDELNLRKVYLNKDRIYINLYLDPLPEDQLANLENDDDDYEAIQQEKQRQIDERKRRQQAKNQQNQRGGRYFDENAKVKGLWKDEQENVAEEIIENQIENNQIDEKQEEAGDSPKKSKTEKKKKKPKKKKQINALLFDLEGGESEEMFEGGSGDEEDDGAQSIKPKGKKKGKKSKTKKSDTFQSKPTTTQNKPVETEGDNTPLDASALNDTSNALVVDDLDGQTVKTKKSKKSAGKKKKRGKSVGKDEVAEEGGASPNIQLNKAGLAGLLKQHLEQVVAEEVKQQEQVLEQNQEQPPAQEEDGANRSRRSKRAGSAKKRRGARSSSARRQRTLEGEEDPDGPQTNRGGDPDLRPDYEAEELGKKSRVEDSPSKINKEDLFKPVSQYERERLNEGEGDVQQYDAQLEAQENAKSVKSKKKGKKKKGLKKKKVEDSSSEDEDEPEEEKKQERDGDEEPAGCCQFCFWNFREGHRCLSFFSFYNDQLPRPFRWGILIMSWYLFMTFTGLFMGGDPIIAEKSNRIEQFVTGALVALFIRVWILLATFFLMHPKPEKIREQIPNKIKANREIRNNNMKLYAGLCIILISIIFGAAEAFSLSAKYQTGLVQDWAWAFLFSIIADFIIVDGLFMGIVTIITVKVGAAPDACGLKREMWLKMVPPAIKDSIE